MKTQTKVLLTLLAFVPQAVILLALKSVDTANQTPGTLLDLMSWSTFDYALFFTSLATGHVLYRLWHRKEKQ